MADKIFVPGFWPFWKTPGKLRRFDYRAIDDSMPPITSVFSYDVGTDSMLLTDYNASLQIQDIWYYQYRVGQGVAEWRDDYPTKQKKVVMDGSFGSPIMWGEYMSVGEDLIDYPKMNPFLSWPPAAAKGVQIVHIEEYLDTWTNSVGTYNDVLVYTYLQAWDGHAGGGARYWAQLGTGPISLQWLGQDPSNPTGKPLIVTSRMDATISDVDNSELIS